MVGGLCRQHQNLGANIQHLDSLYHFDAIKLRYSNIKNDNIWMGVPGHGDSINTIINLA